MKRFIPHIIAGVIALGVANTWFQTARASELPAIAQSTYKLYEGDRGMCSITFMKNDPAGALFLTAAHCIDGADLNVREQQLDPKDMRTVVSEKIFYAKAVRTLVRKDIAVLQLRDPLVKIEAPGVDVATTEEAANLRIGDELMVVGYPAAAELSITTGMFTGLIAVPEGLSAYFDAPMYQTTVPIAGGNSGGGLYAEFDGTWKLIGTVTAMRIDNGVMTYHQSAETVNEALRGFVTKSAPPKHVDTRPGEGIDAR